MLAAAACSNGPASRPIPPAGLEEAAYVGGRTCATCHAGIAATFARSGMGRSFYPLAGSGVESVARMKDHLEVPGQRLRYAVFSDDERYYQKQFQLDGRGRETNVDVREMVYVIGSGNHSLSFVTEHEGRLYQMPLCWYPEAARWDLCPGYELRNEYFGRQVDDTCLFCHNGRVEPAGRYSNRFKDPLPHGINCERCHGPGSLHLSRWTEPAGEDREAIVGRSGEVDPTILNPRRLPADLRIQVCMQCHLGDAGQTERVMRRRDHMDAYRPGLPLQRFLSVHSYRQRLPGRFGLGSQADRLALSRCFQASSGRLQCVTCHDPHVEVYDLRKSDPGRFSSACSSCHARDDCALPASDRGGGDCVTCHMRRAEPHDQRYTTFTDHWIRRLPEEGVERVRDDFTMEPFFADAERHEPPAERALNVGRAYLYKKAHGVDAAAMPWRLPLDALTLAARSGPDEARAHFFLGKAAAAMGRLELAESRFRRAVEIDPRDTDALQELGSALLARGALEEAASSLERALQLGPRGDDEGAVLNELARVEMQRGRLDSAAARLEAALAVEPYSPEIHANRGLLASLRGNHEDAAAWFRKALAYAPNHAAIHVYLAETLLRNGPQRDPEAALFEAVRALELSPADDAAGRALAAACAATGRSDCAPAPLASAPAGPTGR